MTPRYYQSEAVQSVFDYYLDGNTGNPLIALPTGTGKSFVNALLIMGIVKRFPGQQVLCLTHVKELIEQNYSSLIKNWPTAPAGIYSAGVGRKDVGFPITFAGIGSIHKKAILFKATDIIIVDEAHLISPKSSTMYGKFIAELKESNPHLIVVGMTATPYRVGQGRLTDGEGALFTDVCYDKTDMLSFNQFIDEGFLAPLIPMRTEIELDTSGIKMSAGEYNIKEMQERYNVDNITQRAVEEIIKGSHGRNHWLIFATGVEHCERIASLMNEVYGVPTASIHSKLKKDEREGILKRFKAGEIKAVVNNNVLTTGFDFPKIDLIGVLRPTNSPGLWVQMLGRGTRVHPEKENCLVLDFAANTKRIGPINDPIIPTPPKARKNSEPREAPVKICDNCGMYNHASVRVCKSCGFEFPRVVKIRSEAAQEELIKKQRFDIRVVKVNSAEYTWNERVGKTPSVKVTFFCGLKAYPLWLCFDHHEAIASKARKWWRQSTGQTDECPRTAKDAFYRVNELKPPLALRVRLDTKYPEIMDFDFDGTKFMEEKD